MKPEKAYRRQAIVALGFIQKYAAEGKEVWKGQTPPTMEEVDSVIRDLSYFVGALKNYRSIRIQMEKEKDE